MGTTPILGLPYPELTSDDNVPADMKALGVALDAELGSAWTPYTPVWTTSGTAPTLGNGTLVGSARAVGKTVDLRIALTIGSTTAVGTGNWRFTLPVAPVSTPWVSSGVLFDASAVAWWAIEGIWDGTLFQPWCDGPSVGGALTRVASTTPITWATGDVVLLTGTYESA